MQSNFPNDDFIKYYDSLKKAALKHLDPKSIVKLTFINVEKINDYKPKDIAKFTMQMEDALFDKGALPTRCPFEVRNFLDAAGDQEEQETETFDTEEMATA